MSSARHQNTNGTAERSIAYVEELLRMGINYEQNNWSQLCPRIQHSINTSKSSMGYSPYFIERGRHPMTALDRDVATRQKEDAPENMKSFVDRIWILDDELRERRRAVDSWMETHANQRCGRCRRP